MWLVVAILLTIFVLSPKWGAIAIVAAAVVESTQAAFWFWYTHRKRPVVGVEAMVGAHAEVVSECRPDGWVRVHGELWRARCPEGADVGRRVRVVNVDQLTLLVEPV
jgi:membrane-bound ClpP family serine protease